jgi:hypothetical protein
MSLRRRVLAVAAAAATAAAIPVYVADRNRQGTRAFRVRVAIEGAGRFVRCLPTSVSCPSIRHSGL